jgi:tRNA-dihydrouridine synthase
MLTRTAVDAVCFARGALGNPFVFRQTRRVLTGEPELAVTMEEKVQTALEELRLLVADLGERSACLIMRKRFAAYLKGIPGAAELRAKAVTAVGVSDYEAIARTVCGSASWL